MRGKLDFAPVTSSGQTATAPVYEVTVITATMSKLFDPSPFQQVDISL